MTVRTYTPKPKFFLRANFQNLLRPAYFIDQFPPRMHRLLPQLVFHITDQHTNLLSRLQSTPPEP